MSGDTEDWRALIQDLHAFQERILAYLHLGEATRGSELSGP